MNLTPVSGALVALFLALIGAAVAIGRAFNEIGNLKKDSINQGASLEDQGIRLAKAEVRYESIMASLADLKTTLAANLLEIKQSMRDINIK